MAEQLATQGQAGKEGAVEAEGWDPFDTFDKAMGGLDSSSLQVNFNDMPIELAEASVRLFGERVIPHFDKQRQAAE